MLYQSPDTSTQCSIKTRYWSVILHCCYIHVLRILATAQQPSVFDVTLSLGIGGNLTVGVCTKYGKGHIKYPRVISALLDTMKSWYSRVKCLLGGTDRKCRNCSACISLVVRIARHLTNVSEPRWLSLSSKIIFVVLSYLCVWQDVSRSASHAYVIYVTYNRRRFLLSNLFVDTAPSVYIHTNTHTQHII